MESSMVERICSFDGCERTAAKDLCAMHRQQVWRTGRTQPLRQRFETLEERFWSKVSPAPADECWLWSAFRDRRGYGRFSLSSTERSVMAHRVAYEFLVGSIPEGLELDHLCRTPACVNPWHLDPVTGCVNKQRAPDGVSTVNARKTHCPQGHAYDEANTRVRTRRHGVTSRICRTCHRDAELARYHARKKVK